MKDGQAVQQHVLSYKPPLLYKHRGVASKIFVGEHDAFGPACCPRGIKQHGEIIGFSRNGIELIGLACG